MSKVIITVTGGSGSGKSTLVTSLCAKYPARFKALRLEDYYLPFDSIKVRYKGRANLDVEEAFDKKMLINDMKEWLQDKDGGNTLLFEGFIANFILEDVRLELMFAIYLDAPHELRFSRRQGEMMDKDYEQNVLMPMHRMYVEPQKERADVVIDVSDKTIQEVECLALGRINDFMKGIV